LNCSALADFGKWFGAKKPGSYRAMAAPSAL